MSKLEHYMSKLKRYPPEYWFLHYVVWIIYFILLLLYNYFDLRWEKNSELICTIIICQTILFWFAAYRMGIMYQKRDWVKKSLREQAIWLGLFSFILAIISQLLDFGILNLFSSKILENRQTLLTIQPILLELSRILKELADPSTTENIENINTFIFKALWGEVIQNIIAHFSFLYWWSLFYTRIQDRLLTGLIYIRVKGLALGNTTGIHLADVYFVRSVTDAQGNSTGKAVEIYTKDSAYILQGSLTNFKEKYNVSTYFREYFGPANRRKSDVETQSTQVSFNYTKCMYDETNPDQVFFERDEGAEEDNTILLSENHKKALNAFRAKPT